MRWSVLLVLFLGGCIWPMAIIAPVDTTVVDAETGKPIPNAKVVYLSCDVHDYTCNGAKLVRAAASKDGVITVSAQRDWGPFVPLPGGLPVPNHFVAVWADGYTAWIFAQYGDTLESRGRKIERPDIVEALNAIPRQWVKGDYRELDGGQIRLKRTAG